MADNQKQHTESIEPVRGLPMFSASDQQALEKEKAELATLNEKGFVKRWAGYSRMTGPGWLQSAHLRSRQCVRLALCGFLSAIPTSMGSADSNDPWRYYAKRYFSSNAFYACQAVFHYQSDFPPGPRMGVGVRSTGGHDYMALSTVCFNRWDD